MAGKTAVLSEANEAVSPNKHQYLKTKQNITRTSRKHQEQPWFMAGKLGRARKVDGFRVPTSIQADETPQTLQSRFVAGKSDVLCKLHEVKHFKTNKRHE